MPQRRRRGDRTKEQAAREIGVASGVRKQARDEQDAGRLMGVNTTPLVDVLVNGLGLNEGTATPQSLQSLAHILGLSPEELAQAIASIKSR